MARQAKRGNFQVKNLPIKSPKVPTLKTALRRFHQIQRGRNSKSTVAKLTAEVVQKEENENKEGESSPMIQLGKLKILQ